MTAAAGKYDELLVLLDDFCDGVLSSADARRLDRMLQDDPAARRQYIAYLDLHAGLGLMTGRGASCSQIVARGEGCVAGDQGLGTSVPSGQGVESREPRVESGGISGQWPVASGQGVQSPESRVESGIQRPKTQDPRPEFPNLQILPPTPHAPRPTPLASIPSAWAFSYAVATLLLGIALLGAWFHTITHPDADSLLVNKNSRRATPSGDTAKESPQFTFVGKVSGMVDCQFADSSTSTVSGAAVSLNRRYALRSGLMEISYDSGAKVILQGPCEYTVESRNSGYLHVGKLVAKVESQESRVESKAEHSQSALTLALSQGERGPNFTSSRLSTLNSRLFAVRTPTATVEDLGTEFGVEVSESGETASHVFAGRVVMRTEGAGDGRRGTGDDNSKSNIQHPTSEILLSAGQSGRVEPGKDEILSTPAAAADADRFVRAMPPPRAVQDSQAYEKLVLSLDPAVFYRMERPKDKQGSVIADSATGGHHGRLHLGNEYGSSPFVGGRFGSALNLRGPDVPDYAIVPDYPKAKENKLTVSAWVYATGQPGWAMIAANWGTYPEAATKNEESNQLGQFHLGLYRTDGDLCAQITQSDGQWVQVREGSERPFPLGVWQHVALVVDGKHLRLYRNGNEVNSVECLGIRAQSPVAALGIGCKLDETGMNAPEYSGNYNYWQGRIDEVAIFNDSLSIEAIQRLYRGKN